MADADPRLDAYRRARSLAVIVPLLALAVFLAFQTVSAGTSPSTVIGGMAMGFGVVAAFYLITLALHKRAVAAARAAMEQGALVASVIHADAPRTYALLVADSRGVGLQRGLHEAERFGWDEVVSVDVVSAVVGLGRRSALRLDLGESGVLDMSFPSPALMLSFPPGLVEEMAARIAQVRDTAGVAR